MKLLCFTVEVAKPSTRPICTALYPALCDFQQPIFKTGSPYKTRMAFTVVERLCLVKVSGVVTPSPVGVAMEKLK